MKTNDTTSRFNYELVFRDVTAEGKKMYGPGFEIHEIDKPVVRKLFAYVLHDEVVAAAEGIDFRKGILLTGCVGCGKTALINIVRKICPDTFKPVIKLCREISIEFGQKGFDTIAHYSTNAFHPYSSVPRVYCFDGLGEETTVSLWGKWDVMVEILSLRYDLFISHRMITHVTTILNSTELGEIYGNTLRSKMRAMFNLVAFDPDTVDKR